MQEITDKLGQIPDNVWMPLVVALVTTVVITPLVGLYIKPWVEARKQRLIRDREQIDEVIFKFQKISLCLGALVPDGDRKNRMRESHNGIMLNQAHEGIYELMNILSRLSHRYAQIHKEHIGKTMLYLGNLLAVVDGVRQSKTMTTQTDSVAEMAQDLEKFDVYFLANVGLRDSQEKWFRRAYWRCFTYKSARREVDEVLKRHGLRQQ